MRVLLAGVTGQLGHGMATTCRAAAVDVVPLTRSVGRLDAPTRLARLFPDDPALAAAVVAGDVTAPMWGLQPSDLDELAPQIDAVVNVAAETNWASPRRRLHQVNVLGARYGLDLAVALHARHPRCGAYVHSSSVFTAGGRVGRVAEEPFPPAADRTEYEHSKWLAEQHLLERARSHTGVAVGIARIGGLLGDSVTGHTAKRNSLYLLADRASPAWRFLPVTRDGRVDMLPRDLAASVLLDVVKGVLRLGSREAQIVHVCAGDQAPTLHEVLASVRRLDSFGWRSRPRTVRLPEQLTMRLSTELPRLVPLSTRNRIALEGLRYLIVDRVFERDRLARFLSGPLPSPSTDLLARLAFELPSSPAPAADPQRPFARYA